LIQPKLHAVAQALFLLRHPVKRQFVPLRNALHALLAEDIETRYDHDNGQGANQTC
jgi:hypothetical protein